MKTKLVLLLFALSFLGIACDPEEAEPPISKTLIGSWQWESSSGGITGDSFTPQSTGKHIVYTFTSDGELNIYENQQKIKQTTYVVSKDKSIYTGKEEDILDSPGLPKSSFRITDNRLYLYNECYDCYTSSYKKILHAEIVGGTPK